MDAPEDRDELELVGESVARWVRAGLMTPDEAYAWARIVCEMARPWRERA